jgi:hypothetical protein
LSTKIVDGAVDNCRLDSVKRRIYKVNDWNDHFLTTIK